MASGRARSKISFSRSFNSKAPMTLASSKVAERRFPVSSQYPATVPVNRSTTMTLPSEVKSRAASTSHSGPNGLARFAARNDSSTARSKPAVASSETAVAITVKISNRTAIAIIARKSLRASIAPECYGDTCSRASLEITTQEGFVEVGPDTVGMISVHPPPNAL